jgi:hypothetical protein
MIASQRSCLIIYCILNCAYYLLLLNMLIYLLSIYIFHFITTKCDSKRTLILLKDYKNILTNIHKILSN